MSKTAAEPEARKRLAGGDRSEATGTTGIPDGMERMKHQERKRRPCRVKVFLRTFGAQTFVWSLPVVQVASLLSPPANFLSPSRGLLRTG